jgi:hydrogenase maturation protease
MDTADIHRTWNEDAAMLRVGRDAQVPSPARDGAVLQRRSVPIPLVLGFGNTLLGDDGAGVHLMTRLSMELGPDAAQFIDGGTMSFSLLPYVEMADSMLIVDAANLDQPPGTVLLLEGSAMDVFLKTTRRRSVHEVGLIDLLAMARLHGCLPNQRALLCIQPKCIDWSETLSPPVAAALPEAATQARAALQRWKHL